MVGRVAAAVSGLSGKLWKIVEKRWTRLPNIVRDGPIAATITEVKFTTTHQERRCTICGYTQQEKVEF